MTASAAVRDVPTVGRSAELARTRQLVGAVERGQGGVLLVVGEAGIGKSRLLAETADAARAARLAVLTGRAVPGGGTYRAVAEALVVGLGDERYPAADVLRPYRPALGRLLPGWADNPRHAADAGAAGRDGSDLTVDPTLVLGEGLLRLLALVGGEHGCLLVLEDLHWADPDTLALVEYLAGTVDGWPLLVALSARDDEDRCDGQAVRRLGALPGVTTIALRRLDAPAVVALADARAGQTLPEAARRQVVDQSDGLPLLVEELVDGLVTDRLAGEPTGQAPSTFRVPSTFRDLVAGRLGALTAEQRQVVEAAAVLGDDLDWTLLGRVTAMPEPAVLAALRAAHPHLLVSTGDRLRWRHALTREAVSASLLPPERAVLARRAAEALLARGRSDDQARAADLFVAGADRDRAATILLRLARDDLATGAARSAEELLGRASEAGARPGDVAVERVRLLTLLGQAPAALDVGASALAAGAVVGDQHAKLCLRLADAAVVAGRWDEVDRYVERAGRPDDPTGLALAADAAFGSGDPRRAAELAAAAVARVTQVAQTQVAHAQVAHAQVGGGTVGVTTPVDAAALVQATTTLARCALRDDPPAALASFRRAAALAAEHGLLRWRVTTLIGLSTAELFDRASSPALLEARELALDAGLLAQAVAADLMLVDCATTVDGPRAAEELARQAAEQASRLRLSALLGLAELFVAFGRAAAGDRTGMETALAAAVARPDVQAEVVALAPAVRALRRLLDHDVTGAVALLDRSADLLLEHGSAAPVHTWGLWALLRTVVDDRGERARDLLRASPALPRALNRGGLLYAEAVAEGRTGRRAQATALFDAADELLAEHHWWRRLLRLFTLEAAVADGWGDPVPALRADLDSHVRAGDAQLARICRDLLRRAGAPTRRGRGLTAVPAELRAIGVTSREMDVLDLVVGGLTNREIAERLFLSRRTVDTHVANLLAKTGAANRAQLRDTR